MKIKEAEEYYDDNIEEAMFNFVDSCVSQGYHNHDDNIRYFMRESGLARSEFFKLRRIYYKILDSY